jgi:hypothetical protein
VKPDGPKIVVGYPWWLRPFLMQGVVAITLGRRVYLKAGLSTKYMEKLLRHELAHVRQIERLGLLRFYASYAAEFVRHWRRVRSTTSSQKPSATRSPVRMTGENPAAANAALPSSPSAGNPLTTTSAPSRNNSSAIAKPMPWVPPVTMAVFPARSIALTPVA